MVRIKERYLLVNILYPPETPRSGRQNVASALVVQHQPTVEKLTAQALVKAIRAEAAVLYGDFGAGALEGHLSVKYLSLATSTFILRCSRAHYQLLWSTLTFLDRVPVKDGRPCIFRVVRVSGTIRKVEQEAIRQARKLIIGAKEESQSLQSHFAAVSDPQDEEMRDDASQSGEDATDECQG